MSKIRKSAKGEECQIRLAGVCNGDPATTVLAHRNGGGMGIKSSDILGAYACSACHDAVDGRLKTGYSATMLNYWHMEGIERTILILIDKGLVIVP